MAIPEDAFISNFTMTIKGKEYVSLVEKKEDAREIYETAMNSGYGAGNKVNLVLIVNKNQSSSEDLKFNVNNYTCTLHNYDLTLHNI